MGEGGAGGAFFVVSCISVPSELGIDLKTSSLSLFDVVQAPMSDLVDSSSSFAVVFSPSVSFSASCGLPLSKSTSLFFVDASERLDDNNLRGENLPLPNMRSVQERVEGDVNLAAWKAQLRYLGRHTNTKEILKAQVRANALKKPNGERLTLTNGKDRLIKNSTKFGPNK